MGLNKDRGLSSLISDMDTYYNPLLHIFELLRFNFFENYPLQDEYSYFYAIFWILLVLFIGLFIYYYNRQALTAVKKE